MIEYFGGKHLQSNMGHKPSQQGLMFLLMLNLKIFTLMEMKLDMLLSRPTCTRIWMPSSVVMAKACFVSKNREITPSQGANTVSLFSSMARPSPVSFSANTGSGTEANSTVLPEKGANRTWHIDFAAVIVSSHLSVSFNCMFHKLIDCSYEFSHKFFRFILLRNKNKSRKTVKNRCHGRLGIFLLMAVWRMISCTRRSIANSCLCRVSAVANSAGLSSRSPLI